MPCVASQRRWATPGSGGIAVAGEEQHRVPVRQRGELESLDTRQVAVVPGPVRPRGEEKHNGIGDEPLGREEQCIGRGPIEPLGIVDDDE